MSDAQPQYEIIFAWLAIVAVGYHAVAMVLLHFLEPQINPLSDMVSAYLDGPHHLLARSTFLAFAVALAALGVALQPTLPPGWLKPISLALIVIAVIGFTGVAIAPTAARYFAIPTQPATVIAIILLSLLLRLDHRWNPVGVVLLAIALTMMLLFILTIALRILSTMGLGGLANRVVVVLIYLWIVLVAKGLLVG